MLNLYSKSVHVSIFLKLDFNSIYLLVRILICVLFVIFIMYTQLVLLDILR